MKPDRLLNRAWFSKLHGMDPLDATILKQDEPATGFAAERWQVNWTKPMCSLPESDVRYLEFRPHRVAPRSKATALRIYCSVIRYIDKRRFSGYFWSRYDDSCDFLDSMLHAVADPTRRRILGALNCAGRASAGKNSGLCAGDIEERVSPLAAHHFRTTWLF